MRSTTGKEEPSTYTQWREQSKEQLDAPVILSCMSKEDIEEFRQTLVKSYKCRDSDITYKFQKISNENDPDRINYLNLVYMLAARVNNRPPGTLDTDEIFSTKVLIPEGMREMAQMLQQQGVRAERKMVVRAPEPAELTINSIGGSDTYAAPRPKPRQPRKPRKT